MTLNRQECRELFEAIEKSGLDPSEFEPGMKRTVDGRISSTHHQTIVKTSPSKQ